MSPAMAAAAALTGRLTDVRELTDSITPQAKSVQKLEMAAYTAEVENGYDIERVGDHPVNGQQSGIRSTRMPSTATGMVPF